MAVLAFALSFFAAVASCRWSRLCAAAFAFAFAASALYLALAHATPLHHAAGELEPLRLVSVATGAMGAVELIVRARCRCATVGDLEVGTRLLLASGVTTSWAKASLMMAKAWGERYRLGRPDAIASLLVASSLVDGASWLWWRATGQWGPLPAVSCLLYAGVCVVGLWRRGRA